MARKIAIVTAGGAVSCFHAAMKAMHETLEELASGEYQLVGANGGVSGLNTGDFIPINYNDIDENRAGSMIGADRNHANINAIFSDIYAFIMMGGDNHLGEANKCFLNGLSFVGWPKTMDGDISSHISLGWESAVKHIVEAIKHHYHTPMTYRKIFYAGFFGRDTDWMSCGISAYANVLVIPGEQKYGWDYVMDKIEEDYQENGKMFTFPFSIIGFAENCQIEEMNPPPKEHQKRDSHGEIKLQPKWIALELERLTRKCRYDSSSAVHEYDARDFPPTETDKRLAKIAGRECIKMILDSDFGKCPVFVPDGDFYKIERVPLEKVARKRKVKEYDYFDYENLKANPSFVRDFGNLFRPSLGEPPKREDLVYKNMLRNQ